MKIVGLTGGIGSGKSTVAKIFLNLGIPVYMADAEAKKISERPDVLQEIATHFGNTVLTESGQLNRSQLAEIVFNNEDELHWLNHLLHPKVKTDFLQWIKLQNAPFVVMESAILVEAGFSPMFDEVICVEAPQEARICRVVHRDSMNQQAVLERIHNQISQEERAKYATIIIKNDDNDLVLPQVLEIYESLTHNTDRQD